jgi:hypothetical protein
MNLAGGVFLVCLALPYMTLASSSPAGGSPVQISGLKDSYSVDEIPAFRITSRRDEEQRLSCSVERYQDGEWREVVLSLFSDDPTNAVHLESIPPHKSFALAWDPSAGLDAPFPSGKYRFRVDLYEIGGSHVVNRIYSRPFVLVAKLSPKK